MKRKLFTVLVLFTGLLFMLSSCSRDVSVARKGNYPVVKKIKTERSFSFNEKKQSKTKVTPGGIHATGGSHEELKLPTHVSLADHYEKPDISVKENKRANRKLREKSEKLRIISEYASREKDAEEYLASNHSDSFTQEYREPNLRPDEKALEVLDNPQPQKGKDPVVFAVVSFVLGAVGLFVAGIPLGILAIVFGIVALRRYSVYGGRLKGFAIAGVVLGVISLLGTLLLLAMV